MDKIDEQLIAILVENARTSLKDLSQKVNLSSPSTSERLRRLEEQNIILNYTLGLTKKPLVITYKLLSASNLSPTCWMLLRK